MKIFVCNETGLEYSHDKLISLYDNYISYCDTHNILPIILEDEFKECVQKNEFSQFLISNLEYYEKIINLN
jgi:hypothetical protein